MLDRIILERRFNKLFKVVEFKGKNPASKIYGTFKVRVSEDEDFITYNFLDCKITQERESKKICLYQGSTKQISKSSFWVTLHNDGSLVKILLDKLDKLVYYYIED